jgi:cytochrome c2
MLRLSLSLISVLVFLHPAVVAAQDAAVVTRGQALTVQHKCAMCHVVNGKGGKLSKSLDGVGDRLDAKALARLLADPVAAFPNAKIKMPKVAWQPGDIDAVVAYLKTLKAPPAK